ncbi:MAG: AMP-binding protein [Gammaproteobacteria bacterium]
MSLILDALSSVDADRPTLLGGGSGPVTAGGLLRRVDDLAASLAAPGAVAVALDNSPEWLAVDLALLGLGRPGVPVPLWFTPAQVGHLVSAAGLSAWIGRSPPSVPHGRGRDLGGGLGLWPLVSANETLLPAGTAKVTFTSGTTGQPRGVCLSGASLEKIAASLADVGRAAGVRRHLCALPLPVLLENVAGAWAGMLAGAEVVVPPLAELGMKGGAEVDGARFARAVRAHRAESLILVPQLLAALVAALEAGAPMPGGLRFIAVGGARVPAGLLARARRLGLPVHEGYGLSECGSVVSLDAEGLPGAGVGRPLPHARVSLAPDGEILVDGELMLGYAGQPGRVRRPWPTGDLGAIDDQGRLHVAGRKKNVFITSMGRNISPEWIEAELTAEPGVFQAAVFGEGLPGPVALLSGPGLDEDRARAAVERVSSRLPDYARPRRWRIADEPFTPDNGCATANGRPRRPAIETRYRDWLYGPSPEPVPSTEITLS